jgi:hypothetical protein
MESICISFWISVDSAIFADWNFVRNNLKQQRNRAKQTQCLLFIWTTTLFEFLVEYNIFQN